MGKEQGDDHMLSCLKVTGKKGFLSLVDPCTPENRPGALNVYLWALSKYLRLWNAGFIDVQSLTLTVMSFSSHVEQVVEPELFYWSGFSPQVSVEVSEDECAHVSLSESLEEVQSLLVLY